MFDLDHFIRNRIIASIAIILCFIVFANTTGMMHTISGIVSLTVSFAGFIVALTV